MASPAWSGSKKNAIAPSLCSLVGLGSLVDSMSGNAYLSDTGSAIMASLLAPNVIAAPGLTCGG